MSSPLTLALLIGAAFVAGTVDAIAGGGGLVTVPILGISGLSPHALLGTNKGQSVFGAIASLGSYIAHKQVDRRRALIAFPSGFVGALLGTRLVLFVPPSVLRPLVLVLLVGVAAFFVLRRPKSPEASAAAAPVTHPWTRVAAIAFSIGAYDGFFGPGTGMFLIVAFVVLLHSTLARATADAKVVNFASNLAAVCVFAWQDKIVWSIALPMAAAQLVGGVLGARLAVRGGEVVIRRVVFVVVLTLTLKMAYDLINRGIS